MLVRPTNASFQRRDIRLGTTNPKNKKKISDPGKQLAIETLLTISTINAQKRMAEIKLKKQTNKPSLKSMSLIKWDGLEGWMGKMLSEIHWIGSMSEEHGSVVFDLMQSFMSAEVGPSSGLGLFEDRAFIRSRNGASLQ